MLKKIAAVSLLLWASLLGLPLQASFGSEAVVLYVDNRPFEGEYRFLREEVYANLLDLLAVTDQVWALEDNRLLMAPRQRRRVSGFAAAGRDAISQTEQQIVFSNPALSEDSLVLVYEGQLVHIGREAFGGKLFVSVADYAALVGDSCVWKKEYNVMDYYRRTGQYSYRLLSTLNRNDSIGSGYPLSLQAFEHKMCPIVWAPFVSLVGFCEVKNVTEAKLTGLQLRLEMFEQTGLACGSVYKCFAEMQAKEVLSWQFSPWTNFERLSNPRPVLSYRLNAAK